MTTSDQARRVAVILAGGRASRLGGVDKPLIPVRGRTLLAHALEAAGGREKVVVVGGPFDIVDERIIWTREQPPFGGPVAALSAALDVLDDVPGDAEVLLLAADLPDAVRLTGLLDARPIPEEADGLVARDEHGREQWLAGRHRLDALRRACSDLGDGTGMPMRAVMRALRLSAVDVGRAAVDLDTWEAIDEYRDAHPGPQEEKIMSDTPADLETWVRGTAAALGIDPGEVPVGLLLDVTRQTAHGITRPAGPVTTFLIGLAAGRGLAVEDAVATVRSRLPETPSDS